jgi:hypothetical protein
LIFYKSNADKIIAALKKKSDTTLIAAERGMVKGLRLFEGKLVREQLSGRKGTKGLNRRTGNAANSWVPIIKRDMKDIVGRLASRAFYLKTHQEGMTIRPKASNRLVFSIGDRTIFAKKVNIPKRLYVYEEWKKTGAGIIRREMLKEVQKVI